MSRARGPRTRRYPVIDCCWSCGASGPLHEHHVDWNHGNDRSDNKAYLCEFCHVLVHRPGGKPGWRYLVQMREYVRAGTARQPSLDTPR